ncbi:MAG: hypothetical protein ACI9XO_004816 [Paraglaciecola sp.]
MKTRQGCNSKMMKTFDLPKSTELSRSIPKNAFDKYINTKQKKEMTDFIKRMTWINKLSTQTTNLPSKVITEIQVFLIELKIKNDISTILELINRAIPYHIVFVLKYEKEQLISTVIKHNHPQKLNESVVDCTFKTDWFEAANNPVNIVLRESLDWTFIHLCSQITGRKPTQNTYSDFVSLELEIKNLEAKISGLERQMQREKQFNKKVELNMALLKLREALNNTFQNFI